MRGTVYDGVAFAGIGAFAVYHQVRGRRTKDFAVAAARRDAVAIDDARIVGTAG